MKIAKRNKIKKIILFLSIILACLFCVFLIFIGILFHNYKLDAVKLEEMNNGITIYSANEDFSINNTNRTIIDIESLPDYVKNAFIDIEDKRFYKHNGYDLKRIVKALIVDISSQSKAQGASTISQQLIKNSLLTNDKTLSRKVQEIILAIKMEKQYSKDEILEMYLNTIYFGSNAFGIENASRAYFNKSSKDLTINEACCLAGIVKAPSFYSPIINYDNAITRRNLVAQSMYNCGHIDENQLNSIINSKINLNTSNELDNSYEKEAIYEACSLLNVTERELINKGYKIVTYKDEQLQKEMLNINNSIITDCKQRYTSNLDSLSVVAKNNGQVLAYYENSNYSLHNLYRQPASLLKPIAVYLPCLQHNILSPASLILDEEINYSGYSPKNADKKFHGYVSVRDAIAKSLNVPAVKALDYLSIKKSKDFLTALDINLSNSDLNLSLALGSLKNGVNLLNLVSCYSTIANGGKFMPLTFIKAILDKNGKVIYNHEITEQAVVDAESCYLMTDMLKETAISGTAKRMAELNLQVASKTGTANNGIYDTDLYNVAYTPQHTILTWIANVKDNKIPEEMNSSNQPTEINKQILKQLYQNGNNENFAVPSGVKKLPYDLIEYETNHRIIAPTQSLERYNAYDYFKISNPPMQIEVNNEVKLIVELTKQGGHIQFNTRKNKEYYLYKITNSEKKLLNIIKETSGDISIKDNNVFAFDNISYIVEDKDGNLLSKNVSIRPKDFLINYLNNQILSNKKNWAV